MRTLAFILRYPGFSIPWENAITVSGMGTLTQSYWPARGRCMAGLTLVTPVRFVSPLLSTCWFTSLSFGIS